MLFVVSFLGYTLWLILRILSYQNWELMINTDQFSTMTAEKTLEIIQDNSLVCDDSPNKKCVILSLKNFLDAYFWSNPSYCVSFQSQKWPTDKSQWCKNIAVEFQINKIEKGWMSVLKNTTFKAEPQYQQCCMVFNQEIIIKQVQQLNISTSEVSLYAMKNATDDREYESRFRIKFTGLEQAQEVQSHFQSNIRITSGGQTKMFLYSPLFPKKGVVHQQFLFINYVETRNLLGIGQYYDINALQYISQYHDVDFFQTNDDIYLYFNVQPDKNNYLHYPESFLTGFAKLGGLLAILKLGMIIQYYNKHQFDKEINQQQQANTENYKELISIENFNRLIEQVKEQQREIEQLKDAIKLKKD